MKINKANFEENPDKKQIILSNSFRTESDFTNQMKYRYSGKSKKIPHFFVKKNGEILNFLDSGLSSEFFTFNDCEKDFIFVCFENLGWLERVPTKDFYSNFLGYTKKIDIYEKKWRDYFFWDIYTNEQIKSAAELCNKLLKMYAMKGKFVGRNTKINNVEKYNGITCKSNYSTYYTDINPSFPFLKFTNLIENE